MERASVADHTNDWRRAESVASPGGIAGPVASPGGIAQPGRLLTLVWFIVLPLSIATLPLTPSTLLAV